MKTAFLLMAQYDGKAIIPVADVCRDYFTHMTERELLRKVEAGKIKLPIVRIEASQKAARGVHINDLAAWIDARAEAARRECAALNG